MHLFKEQAVRDYAAAAKAIPVIDYGPFFAGEKGALERLAEQVAHACENIGFFYALNHGVPDELIDRAFAASRRFFALPIEQKLALRLNENNIGYLPINASVQGASTVHKATKPNQNESFFISHDRGPDHPDVVAGKPLRGQNQWPADMAGLRADMTAYFSALGAMCDRMLPAFAVALGMPADFFAPYFAEEAHATLRFLHYPPQPDDRGQRLWSGSAHRQQLYDRAGAHRCSRPSREAAFGRVVSAAGHSGNVSNQSRQYDAALVERPLPVHAARRAQRFGHRSLFDRLFP